MNSKETIKNAREIVYLMFIVTMQEYKLFFFNFAQPVIFKNLEFP